jgi:hypothetical protein
MPPRIRNRPNIDSYHQKVSSLATLEEFSADAFRPDGKYPITLCRFIFALAVIHNDFNDIDLALTLLNTKKPTGDARITRAWGLFGGASLHLAKAKISVVHELLNVIRQNEGALQTPAFADLFKKLSREQREAWDEVAGAAKGEPHNTPLGKYLARCRDKVSGRPEGVVQRLHDES